MLNAFFKSLFRLIPDSNKAIEQNESSKNADNQGQKAPISFP